MKIIELAAHILTKSCPNQSHGTLDKSKNLPIRPTVETANMGDTCWMLHTAYENEMLKFTPVFILPHISLMCCDDITCYKNSVLGTPGWRSPASATSITTSTTAPTVASSKAPWSSTPRKLYTQPIAIIVITISSMNSILCISATTED
jgi:hypothetical protein